MQFVPYRMYNKIRNLGDAINPYIIEKVSGLPSKYSPKSRPHVLGIGSIFFDASMQSHIWGSGLINSKKEIPRIDPGKIFALRGKKTVEALKAMGYKVPDVPLGDPGYLVNQLYAAAPEGRRKRFRACIIPHHASIHHPAFKKYRDMDDVCVFNILTDDVSSINDLIDSEVVISQSLHGLIFAESFGIPSVWVSERFDDNWKFKFLDWYSTTEVPQGEPLALNEPLSEMIKQSRLAGSRIDVQALRESLPVNEVITESDQEIVPHRQCKKEMPLRSAVPVNGVELIKLSSLSQDEKTNIEERVKKEFGSANSALAHPVYTLVGEGADDIPEDALERMMAIMDKKHGFVFASIVRKSNAPFFSKSYDLDGLKATKNQHVGQAFLLRANGRISFSREFLTFFV